MKISNQKGVSIVQVIISLGILSGILIAALKIVKDQTQIGKSSSAEFEITYLMDELRSHFSQNENCLATFKGKNGSYNDIKAVRVYEDGKPIRIFEVFDIAKKRYGQDNLKITNMYLEEDKQEFNTQQGRTKFYIEFQKIGGFTGKKEVLRSLNLHITVNELNQILDCFTLGSFLNEKKAKAINPWVKIPMSESIGYSGGAIILGNGVAESGMTVDGSAFIEGNDNDLCLIEKVGAIRYNRSKNLLQLCNSVNGRHLWIPLHSSEKITFKTSEFEVKNSTRRPKIFKTPDVFNFCELEKLNFDAGQCSTKPVNGNLEQTQWEVIATHFRGRPVTCKVKCYRKN